MLLRILMRLAENMKERRHTISQLGVHARNLVQSNQSTYLTQVHSCQNEFPRHILFSTTRRATRDREHMDHPANNHSWISCRAVNNTIDKINGTTNTINVLIFSMNNRPSRRWRSPHNFSWTSSLKLLGSNSAKCPRDARMGMINGLAVTTKGMARIT